MKKRVAINGFGRIGRLTFRNLINNPEIEVVAINDLTDNHTLAHLLKYDSAHGKFNGTVSYTENELIVNGRNISTLAIRNPLELPWGELNVDVVLECTGLFLDRAKAGMHLEAGAKKVLISAPAKGDDIPTIVIGVNHTQLTGDETIISNASCTTNCLAPMVKVLEDNYTIVQGSMTTTHAYTQDQRLQDSPHSDLRRARAAGVSIIPTSTGAASALKLVIPSVKNKISAISFRVPVITGSVTELNVFVEKETSLEDVKAKFEEAAKTSLKGILEFCTDPIVSCDIIDNPHSCILDVDLIQVNGKLIKLIGWYDNEAGYSARLADLTAMVSVAATVEV
jgi:glyceraldehyde 3-phosphate dehydrogenase